METINEVWAHNLRRARRDRTQAEIAEAAELSLGAYQRMESGTLPKGRENLAAVVRALGCEETHLFLDPDLLKNPPDEVVLERVQSALIALRQVEDSENGGDLVRLLSVLRGRPDAIRFAARMVEGFLRDKPKATRARAN